MKMPAIHLRRATRDRYLWISLLAEAVGVALYQLLAGSVYDQPLQSAFTFAGLQYATKYISGGHLNPAISLAATLSGHIDYIRGFSYIGAQIVGGIIGAMLQGWINPGSTFGQTGPGCFSPISDLTSFGLLGWESLMTFLLVAVAYASVFVRPGHGDASPLAMGLALFGALSTGGSLTGSSPLNPARTFAGSLIFKCYWKFTFTYIGAQLTGAILAAAWAWLAFGPGDWYLHPSAEDTLRTALIGRGAAMAAAGEPAGVVGATGGVMGSTMGAHYAGAIMSGGGDEAGGTGI